MRTYKGDMVRNGRYHICIDYQELLLYQVQDLSTCRVFSHVQKRDDSETEMPQKL